MSTETADTLVLYTDNGDGSAEFTVSFADEDHKFSATVSGADDNTAIVSYEETLSWRGQIRVSDPDEEVYRALMTSEKMTEFLDAYGLGGVARSD